MPGLRNMFFASGGKDAHELLQRIEWLRVLREINLDVSDVLEIRRKRSIVEGKKPFPTRAALIIVAQDPAKT